MLIFIVCGKICFDAFEPDAIFLICSGFISFLICGIWLIPKVSDLLSRRLHYIRTIFSFFTFFWIGLSIGSFQKVEERDPPHSAFHAYLDENYGETSPGKIRCVANVDLIRTPQGWQKHSGKVLLMLDYEGPKLLNGTSLLVSSTLHQFEVSTIPGQFDSKRYYHIQGIRYQNFLKPYDFIITQPSHPDWLRSKAQLARNWMEDQILTFLPDKQDAYMLSALLLGIRRKIDPELKAAYSAAGVTHILAVSGMHVGLIYAFLLFLLGSMKRLKHGHIAFSAVIISILWFYGFITGLSPSVLRAVAIFTVFQIGDVFRKPPLPINSLCLATLVLMLWDANIVYDVGYQLSFSAVYGIISFLEPIDNVWKPKNKIVKFIWGHMGIPVSIAATLGTFPVILFYFHQFPTYFLLANALAVPLSSILIFAGIGLLITSPIPIVAKFIGWVLHWGIWLLNQFVILISSLPLSTISDIFINLSEVAIIVAGLIFLQLYFKTNQGKILLYAVSIVLATVSFHLIMNYLAWIRPYKPVALRTKKEWLLGSLNGRIGELNRFGMLKPEVSSPFEAKALKEGFECLLVNEQFKTGKVISVSKKDPEQYSALYRAENTTVLILGNYLKVRKEAEQKINIDFLIVRNAGFKTLENALLLFNPGEIWVDWNKNQAKKWNENPLTTLPIRNFRTQRFHLLAEKE